jgi:uncharacterized protein (DUF58 family)
MRAPALRWRLLRRLSGLAQGDFASVSRGSGFDLVHLSPYQPGDDIRRIDWHASARSGELQVRQLQEDRELTCWLVADLSASQDAGSGTSTKRDLLVRTATLIVQSLSGRGNRIGLWIDDGREQAALCMPPRSGVAHRLRLLEQLRAHRCPQPAQASQLTRLFSQMSGALKRRSLVILLSDLLTHEESATRWQPRLAALAARHDLIVMHLEDPSEWALPDDGHVMVEDAETGEQLWVDGSDAAFRARYEQALQAERQAIHAALRACGARLLVLQPEQDALQALTQWLRRPMRRRVH